jgi:hypothetical protein
LFPRVGIGTLSLFIVPSVRLGCISGAVEDGPDSGEGEATGAVGATRSRLTVGVTGEDVSVACQFGAGADVRGALVAAAGTMPLTEFSAE